MLQGDALTFKNVVKKIIKYPRFSIALALCARWMFLSHLFVNLTSEFWILSIYKVFRWEPNCLLWHSEGDYLVEPKNLSSLKYPLWTSHWRPKWVMVGHPNCGTSLVMLCLVWFLDDKSELHEVPFRY